MSSRIRHPFARTCVALLLVTGTALAASAPVSATRAGQSALDQRIDELTRELGEVTSAEAAQLKDVLAARAARQLADEKVRALDGQAQTVAEQQAAAEIQLGITAGRLIAIEKGIKISQAEIERSLAGAELAAQQMYMQSAASNATPLEFAVSLDDTNTALTAQHYLAVIQRQQRQAVVRRQQAQEELEFQRSRLQAEERDAEILRDRALTRRKELEVLQTELKTARSAALAAEESESAALASIQAQKAAYQRDLEAAQAESEAIAAQLGGGSGGSRPGRLAWPVVGPISSPFGPRPHPIYGAVRVHDGIDFAVGMGVPIKAAAGGRVIEAGWRGGYGNCIIIDHGGGMATLYAHQSRFAVGTGTQVRTGQVIGYVGSTGNSTGPHLHFEVRVNGRPVNPMAYL